MNVFVFLIAQIQAPSDNELKLQMGIPINYSSNKFKV